MVDWRIEGGELKVLGFWRIEGEGEGDGGDGGDEGFPVADWRMIGVVCVCFLR